VTALQLENVKIVTREIIRNQGEEIIVLVLDLCFVYTSLIHQLHLVLTAVCHEASLIIVFQH